MEPIEAVNPLVGQPGPDVFRNALLSSEIFFHFQELVKTKKSAKERVRIKAGVMGASKRTLELVRENTHRIATEKLPKYLSKLSTPWVSDGTRAGYIHS